MTAAARPYALVVDVNDLDLVAGFWSDLLGLARRSSAEDWVDLEPLVAGGPVLSFQRVPERKQAKNRLHLDVAVADVRASGASAARMGATPAGPEHHDGHSPWRTWRDPEGNEFCLVTG